MTHRFPIKEIAAQSGLAAATVDRVLHARPNVSARARARVAAAIEELKAQEAMLAAKGRRLFVDVVIEAPRRFSREMHRASLAALPQINAAVIRLHFTEAEVMEPAQILAHLARIAKRGSHGVCLKSRDLPEIRAAIADLERRGIPVVTIFTDIPNSARVAYAGLDNAAAGRTAGWFMARMLGGPARGVVLTTKSNDLFEGEDARFRGFCEVMEQDAPHLQIRDVSGGQGGNADTARMFESMIAPDVVGIYSMGGGNRAILQVLERAGLRPEVFIAHDLDEDNRALLQSGGLTLVLEHDLTEDMRRAFLHLLAYHRLLPNQVALPGMSAVQIITPRNTPTD